MNFDHASGAKVFALGFSIVGSAANLTCMTRVCSLTGFLYNRLKFIYLFLFRAMRAANLLPILGLLSQIPCPSQPNDFVPRLHLVEKEHDFWPLSVKTHDIWIDDVSKRNHLPIS